MSYAANRLNAVLPSASAAVSQTAAKLKAEGHDVIDLGLGEPDFATPAHIIEAAHRAALAGETRYPPTDGTATLKQAVAEKFKRDNQLDFHSSEIIVANGAKQVIFNALMATLETQQSSTPEVLLCAPYFDSYKNIALVLGAEPVVLPCDAANGFRLTPQLLDAAINRSTRWLLLNTPSNPAGVVYSQRELRELGEVLLRYPQVLVLSDEIYEHIVFDNANVQSLAAACPELRDRILTVNGVSKAYAMTGWRIGYGAGPEELIKAMTKVQSQISSGACSVAQAAAVEALNGPQLCVEQFRQSFENRRNLVLSRIASIDSLVLDPPAGAFYALINCENVIGRYTPDGDAINDDALFCQYLLEQGKVASVPGSTYGTPGYFRVSTATSDELLGEAFDRIAKCIDDLRPMR